MGSCHDLCRRPGRHSGDVVTRRRDAGCSRLPRLSRYLSVMVAGGLVLAASVALLATQMLSAGDRSADGPSPGPIPTVIEASAPGSVSYPSALTTGARGEQSEVNGPMVVDEPGRVLTNLLIRGRLTIRADDVTLRNVTVTTNDFWVLMNYGRNLRVESSTLVGGPNSQAAIGDFDGGNFVGRALDISGAADGVKMGSSSGLYGSFVHSLAGGEDLHNDAIELAGAVDVNIVGNTILNTYPQTSAISLGDYPAGVRADVTIEANLLAGGGYTIYGGAPVQGVVVRDNAFSTRYFPQSGYWGSRTYWRADGNVWSGNRWVDGPGHGAAVTG